MKLLLLFLVVGIVSAFPADPLQNLDRNEERCRTMAVKHGPIQPQGTLAPFEFIFSKNEIRAEEKVTVTIKGSSNADLIKGIMIEARFDVDGAPKGHFDVSESGGLLQPMDCGDGTGNAIFAHIFDDAINEVKFSWTASEADFEDKPIVFYATIAKSFETFWVKVPSAALELIK